MGSVRGNLIAAKALIDTPDKWAHEEKKRQVNGGQCLCALDAISAVIGFSWDEIGEDERKALTKAVPANFVRAPEQNDFIHLVAKFNDHPDTTHADIMALFDRAIEGQK